MVKHLLVIGLCSILALESLFPDVDLADLAHLPELVNHYQKHRVESPGISFLGFLSLHYNDPGHLVSAPWDHKDLPFSKRQHHRITLQIVQELALISIQNTFLVLRKTEDVVDPVIHTNSVTSQVWQPPRA